MIPRKEIVPSILEFVVKLTFIHLSWTGAGKRRCLEQEMEAWVEEAVNEVNKVAALQAEGTEAITVALTEIAVFMKEVTDFVKQM